MFLAKFMPGCDVIGRQEGTKLIEILNGSCPNYCYQLVGVPAKCPGQSNELRRISLLN
jgi:hypothetical protein